MNQNVFSRFNIYDQIGYLMAGAVFLLIMVFNAYYFFQVSVPLFTIDTFLAWFIVAYFLGHLLQGISNLVTDTEKLRFLIPETKSEFDEREKEILQEAKEYFGLKNQEDNKLWNLCYMLANAKDITGQVQAFNSYYSLYRGWFIVFGMQALFIIPFLGIAFNWLTFLIFIFSIALSIIFHRRLKRFWGYTKNKVFETFVIIKTLDL